MCGYAPMDTRVITEAELGEYLSHFSKEVSEDIKKYATDKILLESRYIFTSREKGKKIGYCTHCKSSFSMEGIRIDSPIPSAFRRKRSETAECPNCKSKCVVKASGRGRKTMIDEGYFVYYEKSQLDPNAMVAMGIYAVRDYRGDYAKVETTYAEIAIYIFKMGKSSMLKRYAFYSASENCIKVSDYRKCKTVYSLCDREHFTHMKTGFSLNSLTQSIKNTPFQYSTWNSYLYGTDMVKFFDLYSKNPCIEYLTKMGFNNLVRGKLNGELTHSTINWRAKTILKVLKITKQELNEIRKQEIFVTFFFLKVLQESRKNKWGLSVVEVKDVVASYENNFNALKVMTKYGSMKKILGYMSKQYRKDKKHYFSKSYILNDWKDYIEDCKKLELDITQEYVLYPKSLYSAHQNTIAQIKLKENKALDIKIASRIKLLKKYEFNNSDFILRPAASTSELINEGKMLNHCVGTYAQRYASGTTNIFVIRKVAEPNKPYYTMEVQNNKIIQVRGYRNCVQTKEVMEFVKAFTEAKLGKKEKSKAKESA